MTDIEDDGLSGDEKDVEIIHAISELLRRNGVKGVTGIGPVDLASGTVTVLYAAERDANIPEALEVALSNKRSVTLKINAKREKTSARLLFGAVSRHPWQYSGPLMGGDPLWNDASPNIVGTISFAVPQGSAMTLEGKACANQSITCNHVLENSGGSRSTSTTIYPASMTVDWTIQPPVGTRWPDLGGAELKAGTPYAPLEVRGLRKIKGVKQPSKGIRVSKYGRTTGLTSGRDLGWVQRVLTQTPTTPPLFWVRRVSGYFADVGDSGASVLDADRNLVGIVVSGQPGSVDETYYIQALPRGETPSPRATGAAVADLSCFEVDGF